MRKIMPVINLGIGEKHCGTFKRNCKFRQYSTHVIEMYKGSISDRNSIYACALFEDAEGSCIKLSRDDSKGGKRRSLRCPECLEAEARAKEVRDE